MLILLLYPTYLYDFDFNTYTYPRKPNILDPHRLGQSKSNITRKRGPRQNITKQKYEEKLCRTKNIKTQTSALMPIIHEFNCHP